MIIFKTVDIIKASEINANFDKSNIKTGIIIIFVQREAPTYWIKQNITNNAAIRIVTGSYAREDSTMAGSSLSHTHSFSGTSHNHSFSGSGSASINLKVKYIDAILCKKS